MSPDCEYISETGHSAIPICQIDARDAKDRCVIDASGFRPPIDVYFFHYYSVSSLLPTPTRTTTATTVQNDDYRINAVDPDAATQEMDHDPFETGQSPGNRRCKRS